MDLSPLSQFFEPEFYYFRNNYWSENCPDANKMEIFLLARILENPMELDAHVRRILLNIHFKREPQLIGALQDLFIALGEKGASLKQNLLRRSEEILPMETLALFDKVISEKADFLRSKSSHSCLY